ncbi:response regulator [Allosphingosinicella sp.]|uniref:response regulator n=1 Tax=Allosphingosinicella sp. TaxID=2823234 RepID=UPI002FC20855
MLFGKRERIIRRILIVEDEPLVAFDNEYLLSEEGYEVVATVDSVADALGVIDKEPLDLVLSDIKLSGAGDGIDVARAAGTKDIPVLFVSGYCPIEAQKLAVGCLAKPYSDKMLKAALEAIDRQRQGRKLKKVPEGLSLYAQVE